MTQENDIPKGLSKPALRALAGAGYVSLEQFTKVRATEVAALHGMGPKGIALIRLALSEKGLSFKDEA